MLDKLITIYHQSLFDFCLIMAWIGCAICIIIVLLKLDFELGKLSKNNSKSFNHDYHSKRSEDYRKSN